MSIFKYIDSWTVKCRRSVFPFVWGVKDGGVVSRPWQTTLRKQPSSTNQYRACLPRSLTPLRGITKKLGDLKRQTKTSSFSSVLPNSNCHRICTRYLFSWNRKKYTNFFLVQISSNSNSICETEINWNEKYTS